MLPSTLYQAFLHAVSQPEQEGVVALMYEQHLAVALLNPV